MNRWWHLTAGIALIALAYLGDLLVSAALQEGLRSFTPGCAVTLETVARVGAVALLTWFGWIVLRGSRRRLVGTLMLIVGLYFALGEFLNVVVLANTGFALPPYLPSGSGWNDLLPWTSAAVAVFGAVEVIWPTVESLT